MHAVHCCLKVITNVRNTEYLLMYHRWNSGNGKQYSAVYYYVKMKFHDISTKIVDSHAYNEDKCENVVLQEMTCELLIQILSFVMLKKTKLKREPLMWKWTFLEK